MSKLPSKGQSASGGEPRRRAPAAGGNRWDLSALTNAFRRAFGFLTRGPADVGLGQALLDQAVEDLGVREDPKQPNWGPEVKVYLATVGIDYATHWCAAALHTWIARAEAVTGLSARLKPSPGAQATCKALRSTRRFWPDRRLVPGGVRPGDIAGWKRRGWRGHIGVVAAVAASGFLSIEGNAGPAKDEVAAIWHRWDEPDLLGFGRL